MVAAVPFQCQGTALAGLAELASSGFKEETESVKTSVCTCSHAQACTRMHMQRESTQEIKGSLGHKYKLFLLFPWLICLLPISGSSLIN